MADKVQDFAANVAVAAFIDWQGAPDAPGWLEECRERLGRRGTRGLSRSSLLISEVALRGIKGAGLSEPVLERLPIYIGVASGAEIALPFVERLAENGTQGAETATDLFVNKTPGNALSYLKLSLGNCAGHISKLTGIRGENCTITGSSAGYHALMKAVRLVSSGRHEYALVVSAETRFNDPDARTGDITATSFHDFAGAVLLSSQHFGDDAQRVIIRRCESKAERGLIAAGEASTKFEAACAVADAAKFFVDQGQVEETNIGHVDRWGNDCSFAMLRQSGEG